ncbi:alpha-2-macroglobulin domain protein [Thermoclostridium stercorarium subsp. stercorarium DSM 8532]|uniref:Alpha-2-macroglobulin domain protein n=1 Tax=Thermoclostridium stercorarium (strain ATCC 35414 / DSM 8532 / NCIMB 11754) TaxID=1121335 RepID=L7VLL5_THES1|nr:Ig-like domain-containing alpha-2-macroglobulin family protein [Thermoclostridium stercorarium]AGC67529.1 alpha-2-macroglobulin domain protein [Thermoclostridium stercorarium subsp. stercorarium DSM 8532]AGI38581.1 hypothetical protein Clst_0482 [Thermoclostridium stercorarium subsp. stercorarium DSM 8532]
MKRIIALVLAFTFITALLWTVSPLKAVYAEEYRNGFSLVPDEYDSTGISTDTHFVLKTVNKYSLEQITQMLRLLGDIPLKITQNNANEFIVIPEKELEQNSLYTFVITTPDNEQISWTFQTQRNFTVLGTLPANRSNFVPVNSGIEIYFSHKNFGDIEKYFEISPKVEGRFETNGYAAVFIPKKLEPGTIYTVTVKKGLPLKDTGHKLEKDYVFAFETEPESNTEKEYKGSLYFRYSVMEFSTKDAPLIPIDIYLTDHNATKAVVKTAIYRFDNSDEFVNAVKAMYEKPYWSYSTYGETHVPVDNLAKVSEFEQSFDLTKWQEHYISVPEPLPKGFYLIQSTSNGLTAQTLVQSTDISAYYIESDTKTLFWVNDLKTGKPVESAKITVNGESKTYTTDSSGIAFFDTVFTNPEDTDLNYLSYYTVRKNDDELVLINPRYKILDDVYYSEENYWRYFQTDRTLYKPDDTVMFWGFLRNRNDNTAPSEVTVEISGGSYWSDYKAGFLYYFLPGIQKPLVSLKVPADNGFFEGSLRLPKLSPGNYQLTVKSGDTVLISHYIKVQDYVKPAYKMTVESDKKAIFLNETVNFTITPSFFDGTPLPFLDVSYRISGYPPFRDIATTVKTSADGKVTVPFKAEIYDKSAEGEYTVYINATASLPESGMFNGNTHVKVYVNDIYASFSSSLTKTGKVMLEAKLNKIDIDKINSSAGDEYWYTEDYLGDPVANRKITGTIIHYTYEKIEDGEEYDYINKVVKKRYRYKERKEKLGTFSFTTNEKGIGTKVLDLERPKEGYYTVELTWNDNNGRTMSREVYLSSWNYTGIEDEYDWYHLETDKEKYRTGEEAVVTLKNNDKTVSAGPVLFIEARNGITGYNVQSGPEYKTVFSADKIPNFYVKAVYFNGKCYIETGSVSLAYDTAEKKINFEMKTDKSSYRPGDTVNISITATDENKNPVPARVNIAIIDEAILEISYYNVDVLGRLYQWLSSGIIGSYSSHLVGQSSLDAAGGGGYTAVSEEKAMSVAFKDSASMDQIRARSDFRDTALFKTITLDRDGKGTVSFKLPDNVTSWHVTLAGIATDLRGGTGESSLKVTLPFFISDSMNYTYLSGDFPYVGVSAYGNDLKKGEAIKYQVTCEQKPGFIRTVEGKAFERVSIPLWQLDKGVYDIEIKAISESGLTDGIRRTIYVIDTYHETEKAVTETLKPNMNITGGKTGITTLIFTDAGRGKFIPALYDLAYSGGSRLDQKYIALKANTILDELIPDREKTNEINIELGQYQKDDGGFGILPYSESDVELSALLAEFLKNEAVAVKLKQYFYSLILQQPGRINAPALYGLAALGEPVLLDLKEAAGVKNLTLRDKIYLALAFEEIGENFTARNIYENEIVPYFEVKNPYIRVKTTNDTDTILKETALAALLASRLDTPHKDGLYQYIVNNHSNRILVNAEKLLVITEELNKLHSSEASFSYEYDGNRYNEKIINGRAVTVKIPSIKLSELKITEVKGEVAVTSVFNATPEFPEEPDENLKIRRTYYDYRTGAETTEFRQNDIVKVVIEWDIAPTAMDTHYEIIDFAPSGLKPIENPFKAGINPGSDFWWFRNIDGQKVTFTVFRDAEKKEPLVYYARVVSPGTFTADSTIVQGSVVKDSIKFGDAVKIKITE